MKKILLISCAAMCLILSACRPFTDRPRTYGTQRDDVPQATVTPTPVIIEETKRPATATDLVPATTSPTDLAPVFTPEGGNAALNENRQEIPFYHVFRGFYLTSAEELSAIISGPDKSVIIQDEEGWHDYQWKYCPGIEWDAKFTFPDQYLFADISMGAKPKYVGAYSGEKLILDSEGRMYVTEDYDYNENPLSERIYAYSKNSSDNGAQYFVYIVAVNSSDIPADVAESMKYEY